MKYLVLLFSIVLFVPIQAFGDSITVSTDRQTYHYGDYLSVTIKTSEITADVATMYIIDSEGVKSTAIPIPIKNKTTTITAPNPFDSLIFKEDKYKIEIDYDGSKSFAEFELVDAGNIVMPFGSNIIVLQWTGGSISDYSLLKFLIDENMVILASGKALEQNAKIPSWFRTVGVWWTEKKITDVEFVTGLQYLLDKKVI